MVSALEKRIEALEARMTSEESRPSVVIIRCRDASINAVDDDSEIVFYSAGGHDFDRWPDESEDDFTQRTVKAVKAKQNHPLSVPVLMASTENMLKLNCTF